MDIFNTCQDINNALTNNDQSLARDILIKLLDYHETKRIIYTPLVNHLIRETGLYPYLQMETSSWDDRFVYEAFKVDVGRGEEKTLHREQSYLLSKIISGENIAVSAPTSFGKSFIIDAFIALNKPNNIVIIVPTISLMDETRRRLYKKFSDEYKIITTTDVNLAKKNILIFPQERALSYLEKIDSIDLLIVDEFYKAGIKFDKDRCPSLIRAIMKLGDKTKQKYFLAPNITEIKKNALTKDMQFIELLNFNTVYLEKREVFKEIDGDPAKKSAALLKILNESKSKTLIYAGTYADIEKVGYLTVNHMPDIKRKLLNNFANWLGKNYSPDWNLPILVKKGMGIHNGRLHRSLTQIQIKLFEEKNGLNNIVSTSSIIEGVNTSAENIILWRNRNGTSKLNDFSYKNVIGRGGRMFRHFVGKIYLLEAPPQEEKSPLDIPIPDGILVDIDTEKYKDSLSKEQKEKIIAYKTEMRDILGASFEKMLKENVFQSSDSELIRKIAVNMKLDPESWNGLAYLNSDDPNKWERLIYKVIDQQTTGWDTQFSKVVSFVKVLSKNWDLSIPELLEELAQYDIDINTFFSLEKRVTYKLSAILSDINVLQNIILPKKTDVSSFVSKLAHAFLPTVVFQLEEYGLPRMISKKIHRSELINFLDKELTVHDAITKLLSIKNKLLTSEFLDEFDKYILEYFYDGVTLKK